MISNELRTERGSRSPGFVSNHLRERLVDLRKAGSDLRQSRFAAQAAVTVVSALIAKTVGFFGMAYAAKCLGPYNMGVSGLVFAMVQQVGVIYNGGFDTVAVRTIAVEPLRLPTIVRTGLTFRLSVVLIVAVGWALACSITQSGTARFTWMMGIPISFLLASSVAFAFQGMEHLPAQALITAGGTLATTAAYFLFFSSPMGLGSDLVVFLGVNTLTVLLSHIAYRRLTSQWAVGWPKFDMIVPLVRQSWRYWLLALLIYYYTMFQLPLISIFIGVREAGLYRVAQNMADGIWTLFSAITVLLLPRMSLWHRQSIEMLRARQRQLCWLFCLLGLPPTVVLIAMSGPTFHTLLGLAYAESVTVFRILVFAKFLAFVGQVYLFGLAAAGQDGLVLGIVGVACGFSLLFGVFSITLVGLVGAAIVTSLTEALILVLSVLAMKRISTRLSLMLGDCPS
jgi:O-antigen/teichoic acid export membrane protein